MKAAQQKQTQPFQASMLNEDDPWVAADKLYHVLFCLFLSLIFSTLATFTRHPFLRRHSILIASIVSLLAGAAKEAADHLGYFRSSGASAKDAIADLLGVLIAALFLYFFGPDDRTQPGRLLPV